MKELTIVLQAIDGKVEQHWRRYSSMSMQNPQPPHVSPQSRSDIAHELPPFSKLMHVDLLRFFGNNPTAWVARIQRYFDYYQTPKPQHLIIFSFHLDVDALDLFDWMNINGLIHGWYEFLIAIMKRFGLFEYEDHFGKLSKLMPT